MKNLILFILGLILFTAPLFTGVLAFFYTIELVSKNPTPIHITAMAVCGIFSAAYFGVMFYWHIKYDNQISMSGNEQN